MARTSLIALLMAFSDLEKRKHENFQGNQLKPYEASLMSRISFKNVTLILERILDKKLLERLFLVLFAWSYFDRLIEVKENKNRSLGLSKGWPWPLNTGWPINTVLLNTGSTVMSYLLLLSFQVQGMRNISQSISGGHRSNRNCCSRSIKDNISPAVGQEVIWFLLTVVNLNLPEFSHSCFSLIDYTARE